MTQDKLKQLFKQARNEKPPRPVEGFDAQVMNAIRHDPTPAPAITLWDQLGEFFPRLAFATGLAVGLCFASDLYFSQTYNTSLTGDVAAISEQWLFAANGN